MFEFQYNASNVINKIIPKIGGTFISIHYTTFQFVNWNNHFCFLHTKRVVAEWLEFGF